VHGSPVLDSTASIASTGRSEVNARVDSEVDSEESFVVIDPPADTVTGK